MAGGEWQRREVGRWADYGIVFCTKRSPGPGIRSAGCLYPTKSVLTVRWEPEVDSIVKFYVVCD